MAGAPAAHRHAAGRRPAVALHVQRRAARLHGRTRSSTSRGLHDIVRKCYQLADPAPLTVDETINVIARATGRRVIRIPLTKALAKFSIEHVPGVFRLMRIPSPAVDYFVHPTTYDTTNADAALSGSGIFVPRLADYAANLVTFARAHPEIGSAAMA